MSNIAHVSCSGEILPFGIVVRSIYEGPTPCPRAMSGKVLLQIREGRNVETGEVMRAMNCSNALHCGVLILEAKDDGFITEIRNPDPAVTCPAESKADVLFLQFAGKHDG